LEKHLKLGRVVFAMKHNFPVTLIMVGLFFFSQIVGLFVLDQYIDVEVSEETGITTFKEINVSGVIIERPPIEEGHSFFYILLAIVIATILVFLIIKFRKPMIWKIWFLISVVFCLTLAFSAFTNSLIGFILAAVLGYMKVFRPGVFLHNFTELFVYAGIAVLFVPIMNLTSAFLLLLGISIYDAYAVWKSKHMIKLAQFQTQTKVFAGLFVPYRLPSLKKGKGKKVMVKVKHAILGGGDIAFPLLFAGVILKSYGFAWSFFIPPFATLALIGLFYYGTKERFYPAMPFISFGCVLGFGAMQLVQYLI